jgi:para-nitrobenzyl esterase
MPPRKVVSTQYGSASGYEANSTTWQWLGIPYAKPPLGDLRWKPPQPPVAGKGVRNAIAWSDQAAQYPAYQPYGEGGMSEDCLYLNITAPKAASKFPVMVWFHGGAFMILTSNTKALNNTNIPSLTAKGVVLVTVNHRLGPFGYLAHPWLTAESGYGGSGNYGHMDLIAALRWVKNNIANFGGDPNNVTLFGQSGGGAKALSLMNSPMAKDLFHKVICQSGMYLQRNPFLNGTDRATAEAQGTVLFDDLGVKTLAEARAKPWTEIMAHVANLYPASAAGYDITVYSPTIDGHYLPKSMEDSIKTGLSSDVPLLAGSNTADIVVGFDVARGLMEQMPWRADHTNTIKYVYKFSWVPAGWRARGVTAYHGEELVYVFNYPESFIGHFLLGLTGLTKEQIGDLNKNGVVTDPTDIYLSTEYGVFDLELTDTIETMWTNFAKSGNPSTNNFTWPAYSTAGDQYLEIGSTFEIKTGLQAAWPKP